MLCGRNGYITKEQSLLHDWHGELVGEANWTELSAKYAKIRRVKFNERRIGRKARNEQENQIEETKEEKKATEECKEKWQSSEESDGEGISIEEFT
jgi:hypothetical protein